jgi:CBS domain-containing protein
MRRCDATVSPETSRDEVYRLMSVHGVECLPVASGAILLGLVAREDLILPGGWQLAAE